LAVALVTLAVYIPALRNGFVNWDDPVYVYENLSIRSIDPEFFSWVLRAVVSSNWHPLTMVSHAVDYALWGLNPAGHHLTSIILHALNTGLVFVLGVRLAGFARPGPAGSSPDPTPIDRSAVVTGLVAALLFGLHPLHVESVAWVSERKDVLSALFFLLSLLAYLRYATDISSKRPFYYALCLGLFVLALMSKPMAVTLPVVLLILDYYPLKRDWPLKRTRALKDALLEKLPFFALSAASGVVTLWAQRGAIVTSEKLALASRIAVAVRGYAFYIYKTLVPAKLAPIYPMPLEGEFFNLWFFASLTLLIAITAFCIYTAVYSTKSRRAFLAAWLYYLVTLLPVIGLVQVGVQAVADRYAYLPSIGPFILAGLGAGFLFEKWTRARTVVIAVMVMVSALLAYGTVRQSRAWKDSLTLWSHGIRLYPDRVPTAYYNRGVAYAEGEGEGGDLARAIEDYSTAIALSPGHTKAYLNRGSIYGLQGRYARAIEDFDTAIVLAPGDKEAYYNRGLAHDNRGDIEKALEDYNTAIRVSPDYAMAYASRGGAFVKTGNLKRAIDDYNTAIALSPADASFYNNRGLAYEAQGELLKAIADYDTATRINPGDMDAYLNRGIAYGVMGDYIRAINEFNKAIGLAPESRKAYMNRGVAYLSMGDYMQAAGDLERAVRLGPDDPIGYYDLGLVYLNLGDRARATANLKRAAAMGLEEAAALLAKEGLY
jgi:tetratricopeptide (TPR) repeat protein